MMREQAQWFEWAARRGGLRHRYLVFLPPGYEADDTRWPLLVFLHGAAECGKDLQRVKAHGPPKLAAQGKNLPFVVLAPQCPRGAFWSAPWLSALLDRVCDDYRVDPDRIYLTGMSMGGYGVWELACAEPQRFAAVAPVCGGGDPEVAFGLRDVPVWAFHGAEDAIVPIRESQVMVRTLRRCDGEVKFTVYPDTGHDAWTRTYEDPQLYQWFLQQRRRVAV